MIVRESINFERGIDPKKSMSIGKKAIETQIIKLLFNDETSNNYIKDLIKSISDIDEENLYLFDTEKFKVLYENNLKDPIILSILNEILDKVKTFNPNELHYNASNWVTLFFLANRQEDLWNAKKSWITEYTFSSFLELDREKTINEAKELGPNKVFSLSVVHWIPDLLIWAIENGATNLGIKSNYAIQKACEIGDIEITKLLLKHPEVDPSENTVEGKRYDSNERNYCIRRAAKNGHIEIVKILLKDSRVDPSSRENWALNAALINKDWEIAKLLLSDKRVVKELPFMKDNAKKRVQSFKENYKK